MKKDGDKKRNSQDDNNVFEEKEHAELAEWVLKNL